jgi:hypothetical protein
MANTSRFSDATLIPEMQVTLVVLDIYAQTAPLLRQVFSQGATISVPDPMYENALALFKHTQLGGDVIWISADGVTLDELAQLEAQWLPAVGKALVLIGSNQPTVVNRSLQGLMSARRNNPGFEAVVLTAPDASMINTTCRLMAQQSGGWMRHDIKNLKEPGKHLHKALTALGLALTPERTAKIGHAQTPDTSAVVTHVQPQQKTAEIFELPSASMRKLAKPEPEPAAVDIVLLEDSADAESSSTQAESPPHSPTTSEGNSPMATLQDSMNACMQIDGALGAALCDLGSGMALAKIGGGVNLDMAAAGNTEVIKAKLKTMSTLGLKDSIEDVLITLSTQYHLIRPIPHKQGLFLYLVLDRVKGNLAMARFKLMEIEKGITV